MAKENKYYLLQFFLLHRKHKISFEKLKQGFYETQGSKSDKTNISNSISFFRKNLPSFQQYITDDDLSWVVLQDRKLLNKILKYSWSTKYSNPTKPYMKILVS